MMNPYYNNRGRQTRSSKCPTRHPYLIGHFALTYRMLTCFPIPRYATLCPEEVDDLIDFYCLTIITFEFALHTIHLH